MKPKSLTQHKSALKLILIIWSISAVLLLTAGGIASILISNANESTTQMFDRIRANGYPVTFDELEAWHPLPESENAADYLSSVVELLNRDKEAVRLADLLWNATPHESLTELWDQKIASEADKFIDGLEPIPSYIHAAAHLDSCVFKPTYPTDIALESSNEFVVSPTFRLITVMTHTKLALGDHSDALDQIITGMRIAKLLDTAPSYTGQMMRIQTQWQMRELSMYLLSHYQLNEYELRLLDEAFSGIDSRLALERGTAGARAWSFYAVDEIYAGNTNLGMELSDETLAGLKLVPNFMRRPLCDWEKRIADSLCAEFLSDLPKAWPDILDAAKAKRWSELTNNPPIAKVVGLDTYNFARHIARGEVDIRVVNVVVAIEKYMLNHGKLPESLDKLVPKYIPQVPLDPFDGQPLRYKFNEHGYEVYSVYSNRIDDDAKDIYLDDAGHDEGDSVFRVFFSERRAATAS